MNEERWLSVEEIATHLGISKETIYRWLEKRRIPAHRVGKLWKFRTTEVDEWSLTLNIEFFGTLKYLEIAQHDSSSGNFHSKLYEDFRLDAKRQTLNELTPHSRL